jgi:hypothetical protein
LPPTDANTEDGDTSSGGEQGYRLKSSVLAARALTGYADAGPFGNTCVTIAMSAIRVLEYLDASGRSAFRRWFDGLDVAAAAIARAQEAWQDYKRRKKA